MKTSLAPLFFSACWIAVIVASSLVPLTTTEFIKIQYRFLPVEQYVRWNTHQSTILATDSLRILNSIQSRLTSKHQFSSLRDPYSKTQVYTPSEVSHLLDVKQRLTWIKVMGLFSGILVFIQIKSSNHKALARNIYRTNLLFLSLILGIGFAMIFYWRQFFIMFHQVLFPLGNWSFDSNSGLIQLFPEIFWLRFGLAWVGIILLVLLLTTFISGYYLKKNHA